MKILFVCPGGLPVPAVKGGAVQCLINNLLDENEKRSVFFDFIILTPYDSEAYKESLKYNHTFFVFPKVPPLIIKFDCFVFSIAKFFKMKHINSYSRIFKSFYFKKYISRYIYNNDFDFILFEHNVLLLNALKYKNNLNKYNGKYGFHQHNITYRLLGTKSILNKCKCIITISEFMKNKLLSNEKLNINPKNVYVLKNQIDTSIFKHISYEDNPFFKKFNLNPKEYKIILFAGRINPEKGIDVLLKALLMMKNKKFRLVITGDKFDVLKRKGPYFQEIENLASKLNNKVIYTGYINNNEMPFIYNLSDIVVLPSMWDEPAGLTMLEAVTCEKCVITTNSGGIPEYVGDYAIMIERNSEIVNNLYLEIQKVLMNEEIRYNIEAKCSTIKEHTGITIYYDEFSNIVCRFLTCKS